MTPLLLVIATLFPSYESARQALMTQSVPKIQSAAVALAKDARREADRGRREGGGVVESDHIPRGEDGVRRAVGRDDPLPYRPQGEGADRRLLLDGEEVVAAAEGNGRESVCRSLDAGVRRSQAVGITS
jgi:hypothetical protein